MKMVNVIGVIVIVLSASGVAAGDQQDWQSFQQTKEWNKLDQRLQEAWVAAMKAGDAEQRLQCFARIRAPASRGDQSFLVSKGFNVRLFAGTIARGDVAVKDVPRVAQLYFVKKLTLAAPSVPAVEPTTTP